MTDLNDVERVSLMPLHAAFAAYKVRSEAVEASVLRLSSRAATASQAVWAPLLAPVIPAPLPSNVLVKVFASKVLLPMNMRLDFQRIKSLVGFCARRQKIT